VRSYAAGSTARPKRPPPAASGVGASDQGTNGGRDCPLVRPASDQGTNGGRDCPLVRPASDQGTNGGR
jgi:hypothetical protein